MDAGGLAESDTRSEPLPEPANCESPVDGAALPPAGCFALAVRAFLAVALHSAPELSPSTWPDHQLTKNHMLRMNLVVAPVELLLSAAGTGTDIIDSKLAAA